jgi:hypothetical protein
MNRKATISLLVGSILALLLSLPTRAQVVGATISGTITDARGDSVPNAKVTAKDLATGVSTSTTTNTYGAYSIPNLNPAEYEISASATGFSTARTKATLTVGAKQEVNFSLKVGQVTEVVEVSGAAPAVDTTNSTLTAEVDSTTVRELPLNGRDWASLAQLQPGVAGVRTQELITQVGAVGRGLGTQISIDGNRPTQNSYRLNGIFINDYSNAGPGNVLGANLGVDAIQEFSVITSNYSAEYGYTSGGVVNAITKSGTNQFHGAAFEFIRNDKLDAASFFEAGQRTLFIRNQFGASGGGPIKKDKIWIFGAYEGLRQQKGIPHSGINVPSEAARTGSLHDPVTGTPFTVTPNQTYLTFFPHCASANNIPGPGSFNDLCAFSFSGAQVVPDNYGNGRGDVKFSDNDKMSASFYYDRSTFTQPDTFDQKLEGFFVARKGASIEETHLFTSNLVNTVRVGWNYTQGFGQLTPSAINPDAASTDTTKFAMEPGLHAARIAGIGGGPDTAAGFNAAFSGGLNGDAVEDFTHQTVQTFDDAGLTVGKHSLKFGFMFIRLEEKLYAPFTSNGTAQFASLSDFLTDNPLFVQSPPIGGLATVKTRYMFASIPGVYFQDDWKMRPNLTLNMGLRYEMETIPTEKHGLIANLPFLWTNPTTPSCSTCSNKNFDSNPTTKNFEPRIGFAWDPFHDGKTSVRGGFGMFDALPLPYQLALNNAQTSPGHVNVTVKNCSLTNNVQPCVGPNQFPNFAATNPAVNAEFLNPASAPIGAQSWNFVDRNPKRNYVYQWNLNVQRQVASDLSVTLAYAGSRGFHNPFQTDDLNTVFPTKVGNRWVFPVVPNSGTSPTDPVVCSQPLANPSAGVCGNVAGSPTGIVGGQVVNPFVAEIQSTIWQSKSWYDSLQFGVNKRMSHGLQAEVSFTWSKTEDTSSGSFAGDNFAGDLNPTIPWWDLHLIKGLSDFNVSRNLVTNLLWQVPTPETWHGAAGFLTKGWEIGGILTLSDGVPFWPFSISGDTMGQLNSEPIFIPDRVPGCQLTFSSSGRHGSLQYANPACFVNAQAISGITCQPVGFVPHNTNVNPDPFNAGIPGTCANLLGNLGRNTLIGPGLFNLDYSMVKNTKISKISENFNVQFRAEFFNILNRANFAPPVDNLNVFNGNGTPTAGFGQLTRTQSPERQIQFGLKFIW